MKKAASRHPAIFTLLILALFIVTVITSFGPAIVEDYEKIRCNSSFLESGPLWQKFIQREAGFELFYFRPVNNFLIAGIARIFGTRADGLFRAAGSLAFGLAIFSVYWCGRRLGFSKNLSTVCAAAYATHPFNSWLYFQGSWIGNSLAISSMLAVWICFDLAIKSSNSRFPLWCFCLFFLTYVAGLCKDSGTLIVPMLFPLVLGCSKAPFIRRMAAWLSSAAGSALFFEHRFLVMSANPPIAQSNILNAFLHSGSLVLQYLMAIISGTNYNYASMAIPGPGWPLTLVFLLSLIGILWTLRSKRTIAILIWCCGISLFESVAGALIVFEILPTRGQLLIALLILTCGAIAQEARATIRSSKWIKKTAVASLLLLLGWYSSQSGWHVWVSLDASRFYEYHNKTPYSWKLLCHQGNDAFARQNWKEAEDAFRKSLRFFKCPAAYYSLGVALMQEGLYRRAIPYFIKAIRLDPKFVKSYQMLSNAVARCGPSKQNLRQAIWIRQTSYKLTKPAQ